MKYPRGQLFAAFKAKTGLAAPNSGKTPAQLAKRLAERPPRYEDQMRRRRSTGQMPRQPRSGIVISTIPSDLAILQPPQSAILHSHFFEKTSGAREMNTTARRHGLYFELRQAARLPIDEPIA